MKPLVAAPLLASLLLAGCPSGAPPPAEGVTPAYAAVARGRIDVEGGLLQIEAPREGRLTAVAVGEGDRVEKGQVLATLDPEPARLQLAAASAALAQATAQRELLAGRIEAARLQVQRLAEAAAAGAPDGQGADAAAIALQSLLAEHAAAQAGVAMATQKRDGARYELDLHTLHAPLAAEVVRVAAQPGMGVAPAAGSLFTLLPLTAPVVRAEVSESYIDAVTVGMPALVSTDGGGTERRWPARVLRIGRIVGPATLTDDAQQRTNLRTVNCVLAFDQPPADLRVGQRVLVRFGAPAGGAKAP